MVHDPENPFAEFEEDFKNAKPAAKGSIGRLPEYGAYKGVCTTVDLAGDGVMVDREIFTSKGGTKALKIFLEIVDPEKVGDTTVKGEVHEHVWWITDKMLPYIKRDASTVLGREVVSMAELAKVQWAGHTVEFGLKDESYNGFVNSKVSFFNPWDPKAKKDDKKEAQKETKKTSTPGKTDQKKATAAAGAKQEDVDF